VVFAVYSPRKQQLAAGEGGRQVGTAPAMSVVICVEVASSTKITSTARLAKAVTLTEADQKEQQPEVNGGGGSSRTAYAEASGSNNSGTKLVSGEAAELSRYGSIHKCVNYVAAPEPIRKPYISRCG